MNFPTIQNAAHNAPVIEQIFHSLAGRICCFALIQGDTAAPPCHSGCGQRNNAPVIERRHRGMRRGENIFTFIACQRRPIALKANTETGTFPFPKHLALSSPARCSVEKIQSTQLPGSVLP
jgi:hypothetical protein